MLAFKIAKTSQHFLPILQYRIYIISLFFIILTGKDHHQ